MVSVKSMGVVVEGTVAGFWLARAVVDIHRLPSWTRTVTGVFGASGSTAHPVAVILPRPAA